MKYDTTTKITNFNVNWKNIKSACMTTISKQAGDKEPPKDNIDFKDILSIFVVMVILLAVAAVIEGHITHLIAVWAYGL